MLVWITFREGTRSPKTGFEPSIAHHSVSLVIPCHTFLRSCDRQRAGGKGREGKGLQGRSGRQTGRAIPSVLSRPLRTACPKVKPLETERMGSESQNGPQVVFLRSVGSDSGWKLHCAELSHAFFRSDSLGGSPFCAPPAPAWQWCCRPAAGLRRPGRGRLRVASTPAREYRLATTARLCQIPGLGCATLRGNENAGRS